MVLSPPIARTIIRVGNLGKNLRAARKKLDLTQEQVAERSGVQAGEISRIDLALASSLADRAGLIAEGR